MAVLAILMTGFRFHRSTPTPPLDRARTSAVRVAPSRRSRIHDDAAQSEDTVKSLDEYLELAAVAHGHLCAGQVLGVRLAMLGLREFGITDPIAERKRIVTYVEIDRCLTDAVALVANCRLGKRALKFRDWGKVAATFVDLKTGRAMRIAAKESSKQAAREMFPEMAKDAGQQKAYAQLSDEILFDKKWVKVEVQARRPSRLQRPARGLRPNAAKASISNAKCCKTDALCVAPAPAKPISRGDLEAQTSWHLRVLA